MVGGLATVLHGYARFTADADLVVDLAPTPAKHIIDALTGLGFVPRALAGCYVGRNRDALLDSTLAATPAQWLAWLDDAIEIACRADVLSNRTAGKEKKRVEKPVKPSNFS